MEKLIFTPAKDPVEVPCGSEVHVGMTTTAPYFRVVGFACTKEGMDKANAFARRLVAAYNATRHVPVETLEIDPLTLDGVENTFNRLKAQNAQLIQALEKIKRWEMPETGKFWDNEKTEPMSYAACYGSNGERDIVRFIASSAIAAATITEKTETP